MSQEQTSSKKLACPTASDQKASKCFHEGLKIFGDTWTLFIVNSLADGEKRFCEIQRFVGGVNPVTLTNRLKKLEKFGFIVRKTEQVDKLSVSYSLTKKGSAMLPVLREIEVYARKYLDNNHA